MSGSASAGSPASAMTVLTGRVTFSGARIFFRVPTMEDSTSSVALSVVISRITSPFRIGSPSALRHFSTEASVIVSPSFGRRICWIMAPPLPSSLRAGRYFRVSRIAFSIAASLGIAASSRGGLIGTGTFAAQRRAIGASR